MSGLALPSPVTAAAGGGAPASPSPMAVVAEELRSVHALHARIEEAAKLARARARLPNSRLDVPAAARFIAAGLGGAGQLQGDAQRAAVATTTSSSGSSEQHVVDPRGDGGEEGGAPEGPGRAVDSEREGGEGGGPLQQLQHDAGRGLTGGGKRRRAPAAEEAAAAASGRPAAQAAAAAAAGGFVVGLAPCPPGIARGAGGAALPGAGSGGKGGGGGSTHRSSPAPQLPHASWQADLGKRFGTAKQPRPS